MKYAIVVPALLLSALFSAYAQLGRGTILGIVTDSSGAVILGAILTIRDIDTNATVKAVTNKDGFYTTPPVNVGNYEISVEHAGFKKEIHTGIVLQVDQKAEINIQLQIGAVGESVQVTGEATRCWRSRLHGPKYVTD